MKKWSVRLMLLASILLIPCQIIAAVPGTIFGSLLGPGKIYARLAASSSTNYAMAALNTGFAANFQALSTKDIKSVRLNWNTVTAAGTVQIRIETVDATTGKPTGTLYDANATLDFTPTANQQLLTFAVLPTTGLTVGTQYSVVLLTTVVGTAHTLRAYTTSTHLAEYPIVALTAVDGTTRSNFAEVTASVPLMSFVMDDDTEESLGMLPAAVATTFDVYLNRSYSQKLVLTRSESVAGVEAYISKNGTPAGDLRCRIFNSSDAAVSGTTVTLDKDYLVTGASTSGIRCLFPIPVTLTSGTYRIVFDSASSADAGNSWRFTSPTLFAAALAPSSFLSSTTTDLTAGPIVWTDSTTDVATVNAILDGQAAGVSGSYVWGS